MMSKSRSMLVLLGRVLAIAFFATDVTLHATGVYRDGGIPLWFRAAWGLAAIVALALMERKSESRLVIRGLHPAIQALIVAAIAVAALPDPLRRWYMAGLIVVLYWEGVAQVWSSLREALRLRRRQP